MRVDKLIFGEIWHIKRDPFGRSRQGQSLEIIPNGAMAVDSLGNILETGPEKILNKKYKSDAKLNFRGKLILPGFVDAHLHFPQIDSLGCHGENLLSWLNKYIFPREAEFAKKNVAKEAAQRFVTELLANGTTTSAVFSAPFTMATECLFTEALQRGCRMIIGKVSMDRNAPRKLCNNIRDEVKSTEKIIKKWHGLEGRLFCALTPRFALSCSADLLTVLGRMAKSFPGLYIQTHHAETKEEIKEVKKYFPRAKDYLEVYEKYDLIGSRTLLAHSIHPTDSELRRIARAKASVVHCPTSNLFLGSGLFPLDKFIDHKINLALGTDIGAGTSFSLWATMREAYNVQQLRNHRITPEELFFLATLGGAKCLSLDHEIGNLVAGKKADFQVIDVSRLRLLKKRFEISDDNHDRLFALVTLGDDRIVEKVFVNGKEIYAN